MPIPCGAYREAVPHARQLLTLVVLAGCRDSKPAPAPVAQREVVVSPDVPTPDEIVFGRALESTRPPVFEPVPFDAPPPEPGRRDVPPERGVPFDQVVLGPQPHPFGALEALTPRATRDDILAAVPTATRDAKDNLSVALGVEGLTAQVTFDYSNHLDWVRIKLPPALHPMLTTAWGKPAKDDDGLVWFDRTKHWRADLDAADQELSIGRYVPIAEQFGKGPDGLVDLAPIIGRTLADVKQAYGDRISVVAVDRADHWHDRIAADEELWKLLLPATDICKYFTDAHLVVQQGVVTRIELWQCVAAEASRGVALRAFETAWGKAIPARGRDDLPIFTFSLPRRAIELRWENGGWVGIIRAR